MMHIAVDAMGGDKAPVVNIEGAIDALKETDDLGITLVGKEDVIRNCLQELNVSPETFEILNAEQVIEPHEEPAAAFRKKKNSSIATGIQLLKDKKVDGFVSAGNTGAIVAFSIFILKRLKEVLRPALATFFPIKSGCILALDVGATSDTKPINLLQFAIMGSIYYEKIIGKRNPTVGLLSIGEESSKGKEITYKAFSLIKKTSINFIGNIEGNDILVGKSDVVVMDGFSGNVILKFGESLVNIIVNSIKDAVNSNIRSKIGGFLLLPSVKKSLGRLSYEEYGGAALLGVNGIIIVSHGRSRKKAIKNAILTAQKNAYLKINETISQKLLQSSERGINE
jgi:glycerol-3-phosphate acyltransferase PlsX